MKAVTSLYAHRLNVTQPNIEFIEFFRVPLTRFTGLK
jgi:hypothetical protein